MKHGSHRYGLPKPASRSTFFIATLVPPSPQARRWNGGIHLYCPSPNPSLNRMAKPLEIRTSCRSRGLCLSLSLWLLASSSLSPSCQSALSKTRTRPHQASALNAPDPPVAHECGYDPGTLTSVTGEQRGCHQYLPCAGLCSQAFP